MKTVFLSILVLGISACKSLSSRELGDRVCLNSSSQEGPYSAKTFSAALEASVRLAAKVEENLDLLADFFPRSELAGFLRGEIPHILHSEQENCGLAETLLRASKGKMAELSVMRATNSKVWGGSVLYNGHVFPQLTFEARTSSMDIPEDFKRKPWQSAEDFSQGTAWFEWKDNSFYFHKNGAHKMVLEHLAATTQDIELFRGSGADSSSGDKIMSFRNESTMFGRDPHLVLQGVFFTTSESEARKWANPNLSMISTTPLKLLELAKSETPSVFLDFNRNNLDIAILINSKNQFALDILSTLSLKCSVSLHTADSFQKHREIEPTVSPSETPVPLCQ